MLSIKRVIFTGIFLAVSLHLSAMEREPNVIFSDLCSTISQVIRMPENNLRQTRLLMNRVTQTFVQKKEVFAKLQGQSTLGKKQRLVLTELYEDILVARDMVQRHLIATFGSLELLSRVLLQDDDENPRVKKAARLKNLVDALTEWLDRNKYPA